MAQIFETIIQNYFCRNGGWPRLKGELSVYYWSRVAGTKLAEKVKAEKFRAGCLYLITDNPSMAHQLSMFNLEILKRYQKLLGKNVVKTIKVKIGSQKDKNESKKVVKKYKLSDTDRSYIAECCSSINDSDLAKSLAKLMESSILKQKNELEYSANQCQSCQVPVPLGFAYCPCCERQIISEVDDYLHYLRKKNQSLDLASVEENLGALNQKLIKEVLKINN